MSRLRPSRWCLQRITNESVCPTESPATTPARRGSVLNLETIKDYRSHIPRKDGGVGKATLFQSARLLLGLNCLEPGVEQRVHTHEGQDKFYHVLEGRGEFTVGDEVREAGVGHTVWAPSEVLHGVRNRGEERLVVLVGISPRRPRRWLAWTATSP